jgi:glutamine cyclotransferase
MICAAFAVMLFIGIVSHANSGPSGIDSGSVDTPPQPKSGSGTQSEAPVAKDPKLTDTQIQKPVKITDKHGNEFWIMKTWYRQQLFFTQGFTTLNENTIVETSGLHGKSSLHYLKLNDQNQSAIVDTTFKKTILDRKFFGEGNTIMPGKNAGEQVIYYLTWQSRYIFKYDMNFKKLGTIKLPAEIKEGWGITYDPAEPTIAYISDGTAYIFKVETNNYDSKGVQTFQVISKFEVKDPNTNRPIIWLNELEWANGFIYSNVWQQQRILKIDLGTKKVVKDYDFTKIANMAVKTAIENFNGRKIHLRGDCLNGIAWLKNDGYEGDEGSFFLTGKQWPAVYQVKFVE